MSHAKEIVDHAFSTYPSSASPATRAFPRMDSHVKNALILIVSNVDNNQAYAQNALEGISHQTTHVYNAKKDVLSATLEAIVSNVFKEILSMMPNSV